MPIHVDVITPERLILSEEVDFIAAPTPLGEIGILPRHTPLLTRLSVGELRLKTGDTTQYLALNGGFLEVKDGNEVEIFAETAELADEIDEERARLEVERAKAELQSAKGSTDIDLLAAEATLGQALNRVKIARTHKRRHPKK